MRLIAKKPCSFGGQKFYIGDDIPEDLVLDAGMQEKMGVIAIANDAEMAPGREAGTLFTQEQVEKIVAEAVDDAVNNTVLEMSRDGLQEASCTLPEGITIAILAKGDSDGGNGPQMAVPATPEEIKQVFSILQMNAEEGAKAVAGVTSENVLILLHAADSRKTIKNAAKEQAGKLFPAEGELDESTGGNAAAGTNTEGDDP